MVDVLVLDDVVAKIHLGIINERGHHLIEIYTPFQIVKVHLVSESHPAKGWDH